MRPCASSAIISADDLLPEALIEYRQVLADALDGMTAESGGAFTAEILDPEAGDGALAEQIAAEYGFQPMAASLFDTTRFYFYLTLTDGETVVQIPLPEGLSEEATRRGVEEGLKRFASGLLKTVALVAPEVNRPVCGHDGPAARRQSVSAAHGVPAGRFQRGIHPAGGRPWCPEECRSADGGRPGRTGADRQVFAIDQFLMRGGTVVVGASPFNASLHFAAVSGGHAARDGSRELARAPWSDPGRTVRNGSAECRLSGAGHPPGWVASASRSW